MSWSCNPKNLGNWNRKILNLRPVWVTQILSQKFLFLNHTLNILKRLSPLNCFNRILFLTVLENGNQDQTDTWRVSVLWEPVSWLMTSDISWHDGKGRQLCRYFIKRLVPFMRVELSWANYLLQIVSHGWLDSNMDVKLENIQVWSIVRQLGDLTKVNKITKPSKKTSVEQDSHTNEKRERILPVVNQPNPWGKNSVFFFKYSLRTFKCNETFL